MKFEGFVGGAYKLDSVNVDAQECINLYPESIESRMGKGGQQAYLTNTEGLRLIEEIGSGPIRCIHVDSNGRKLVVSGNKLYRISNKSEWKFSVRIQKAEHQTFENSLVDTSDDAIDYMPLGYYTGLPVKLEKFDGSSVLPGGLTENKTYYVIVTGEEEFKLADTLSDAASGIFVDITSQGSDLFKLTVQGPSAPVVSPNSDDLKDISFDAIDYDLDTITVKDHGLETGVLVKLTSFATPIPGGTEMFQEYYVIKVDEDTIKLAETLQDALDDIPVDLTEIEEDVAAMPVLESETYYLEFHFFTSEGPVKAASMSFNGDGNDSSTLFVDGFSNYLLLDDRYVYYCGSTEEYGYPAVYKATHVVWSDGYFIMNDLGTNKFFVSGLKDFYVDALSFASSEGSPDKIVSLETNNRYLYVFNEETTEVFANVGNPDFPFERIQGGYLQVGCLAPFSTARLSDSIFFVGKSKEGQGIVYSLGGTTLQRISTHAIERAISTYEDPSSARAYTYQKDGHGFYVLNFKEATWVYDVATGLWHRRAFTNSGMLERHRAEVCAFDPVSGRHIAGDYQNGKIYFLDPNYYLDDESEITRVRSFPHVSGIDLNYLFCSKLIIDMETGVGLDEGQQGDDPQIMLDWSDDGGHTWSSEVWGSIGKKVGGIGDFKKRIVFRRLGKFRDRVFRIKITDPVKIRLIDAFIEFRGVG